MEILFLILLFVIFGKLLVFALKASWGILSILLSVIVLPVILVVLLVAGLFYIAWPVLLIVGLIALFKGR